MIGSVNTISEKDIKLSILLRNCKSKEAEVKRINKELANIRSKFKVSVLLHRIFFIIFFGMVRIWIVGK